MGIAFESTEGLPGQIIEFLFSYVPKWRMSNVVSKTSRFHNIGINSPDVFHFLRGKLSKSLGQTSANLSYLQ